MADDLDRSNGEIPRSHEHTEVLHRAREGNLKQLWEGDGVIGDVTEIAFNLIDILQTNIVVF